MKKIVLPIEVQAPGATSQNWVKFAGPKGAQNAYTFAITHANNIERRCKKLSALSASYRDRVRQHIGTATYCAAESQSHRKIADQIRGIAARQGLASP